MLSNEAVFKPLCANPTKWSNTLNQFKTADELFQCFHHFVGLVLKGLRANAEAYLGS